MQKRRFLLLSALLVFTTHPILVTGAEEPRERPNIVLVMADDMGYGDVQALNAASQIQTPNLNRLAREGMVFTDAHTPSAVCTPTRYALLTGRFCWRTRLKQGVLNGYGEPLIEMDRPTLASFLNSVGYECGIVGKWHLGLGFARQESTNSLDFGQPLAVTPNTHGFDFSYVIPASLDFPPYVYVHNDRCTMPPDLGETASAFPAFWRKGERAADLVFDTCLDHLLEQATRFIEGAAQGSKPFFLYFPLTAPHKPVLPHARFRGRTDLGPYGDFVVQVDWTVGEVLRTLDELGVADNTLVIYTSDNGSFMYRREAADAKDHVDDETIQAYRADRHTSNFVFRGTKADIWEAGHRVPFFIRWPDRVTAGSECTQTICLTDVFATLAAVQGIVLPENAAPDSFNFLASLDGHEPSSPREPVIHHSGSGMFAIREGRWKLVLGNGSGGREAPKGKPFERPYQLFDLAADPVESQNLIEQEPSVAAELEAWFEQIYERAAGSPTD